MPALDSPIEFELTNKVLAVLQAMLTEQEHWQRECGRLRIREEGNRACIEAFLRTEPLAWYLMRLKESGDPGKALATAKRQAKIIVDTWSRRREPERIDVLPYFRRLEAWHKRIIAASVK